MNAVELNNLTKTYGTEPALLEVTLSIKKGELVGFADLDGMAVTTIFRILSNAIKPTSGSASVFGLDCTKKSAEIKRLVGYVPKNVTYPPYLSVRGAIQYAASFYEDIDESIIIELCRLFELDAKRRVSGMSLGNRKKIAFICALMFRPKLLILDDPAEGTDRSIKGRLFHLISELNLKGTTVILASRNIQDLQRLCTKTAVFREGSLISLSDTEELLKKSARVIKLSSADNLSPMLEILGVKQIISQGEHITFVYDGDVNFLINTLTNYRVSDLQINLPSLEDTIYRNYEKFGMGGGTLS